MRDYERAIGGGVEARITGSYHCGMRWPVKAALWQIDARLGDGRPKIIQS
jgi:hypothetical protein